MFVFLCYLVVLYMCCTIVTLWSVPGGMLSLTQPNHRFTDDGVDTCGDGVGDQSQ